MSTTTLPFQVGDLVEHRGIVVAPLFPLRDPRARYVTLDAALDRGLSITETSEAGDVPELAVSNPLPDDVLFYDGAEIVGAKQNRILNVTVLVAAARRSGSPCRARRRAGGAPSRNASLPRSSAGARRWPSR